MTKTSRAAAIAGERKRKFQNEQPESASDDDSNDMVPIRNISDKIQNSRRRRDMIIKSQEAQIEKLDKRLQSLSAELNGACSYYNQLLVTKDYEIMELKHIINARNEELQSLKLHLHKINGKPH